MEKTVIKDLLYGGLSELMNNPEFYYRSSVGASYSHWTEKGNAVMLEHVILMTIQMHTADQAAFDKRAKDMVIKGLKGETI
jgi:hypothetical protein